jgi:hypothetical protein
MSREDPITYEELSAEHKQKYDEIKALVEADLSGSFERTRHHGVRWKGFSPEDALYEVDLSTPSEDRTRALRQEVNYLVAHSLHRHSERLVNTLERVALRVVQEIMKNQYSPSGLALGSHKGKMPFQSKPPLPYTFAAPELLGSLHTLSTRWEVILWTISFSVSHLRKFHMGTCVHIYRTATTRYIWHSERLEECLE